MLTKTQVKIMQVFTGHITELFSIRSIGKILHMNHSLVYRSIKPLIQEYKLLAIDKNKYLSLQYKDNHNILVSVEYERRNALLKKAKNKDLHLCLSDFIKKSQDEAFVLLIFGSAVVSSRPRDIDILLIVKDTQTAESSALQLKNIAKNYSLDNLLHIIAISYTSVYEMLQSREQTNVMNEALNKHIIVYGAELFYRLLVRGRQ